VLSFMWDSLLHRSAPCAWVQRCAPFTVQGCCTVLDRQDSLRGMRTLHQLAQHDVSLRGYAWMFCLFFAPCSRSHLPYICQTCGSQSQATLNQLPWL
jgi:hypothetical protein